MSVLYRITSPSKKTYIGVAKHSAEVRFKKHCRDARDGRQTALCNAIRKYGPQAMKIETLLESTSENCFEVEKKAIVAFQSIFPHGYNMTYGGEGIHKMDAITTARHLASQRTEERRAQRSAASKEMRNKPEAKAAAAEVMKDRWSKEEWRATFSEKMKAKWQEPQYLAKMYSPFFKLCATCGDMYQCTARMQKRSLFCSAICSGRSRYESAASKPKDDRI